MTAKPGPKFMNHPVKAGAAPTLAPGKPVDGPSWQITRLALGLGTYASSWDELNDRVFGNRAMLSSNFVNALLRHYGDGSEHLCVLADAGQVLSMCILKPRNRWLWTTFLPAQTQLGSLLIHDLGAVQALVKCLPRRPLAAELLCLDRTYPQSEFDARPPRTFHHATTMAIRCDGNFDAYWQRRPAGLRQNIGRYLRRLEADGKQIHHVILTMPEQMAGAVDRYGVLESSGWKGADGTAISSGTKQERFYADLLATLAARGEAEVHELWVDDGLAASRLAIRTPHRLVMLKTTYDEHLAIYAPGRILLYRAIEHSFTGHPGSSIEFCTDVTRDQAQWATETRPISHVDVYCNVAVEAVLTARRISRRWWLARRREVAAGVEVLVLDKAGKLPPDAVRLIDQAAKGLGIQVTLDWYALLAEKVFASGHSVKFFVLQHAGKAVAVLPMVKPGGAVSRAHGLGNFYTSFHAPAIAPWLKSGDLIPLIRAIKACWPGVTTLTFEPMDPRSSAFQVLRGALEDAGLVPFRFFRFGNWTLRCADLNWATYLSTRKGSVRSTVSRMTKKFAADGGRLELICGGDRMEAGIAAYERVYSLSWKQSEAYPEFVRELIRMSADREWLRLGVAWMGDQPVAVQVWFVFSGRAEIFKVAYDEAFKEYSPGTLITAQLMRRVLDDDRVREVDYLTGDDPYKKLWMSHRRERWGIVAYNVATWRGVAGLARECLVRAAKASTILRRIGARLRGAPEAAP